MGIIEKIKNNKGIIKKLAIFGAGFVAVNLLASVLKKKEETEDDEYVIEESEHEVLDN